MFALLPERLVPLNQQARLAKARRCHQQGQARPLGIAEAGDQSRALGESGENGRWPEFDALNSHRVPRAC